MSSWKVIHPPLLALRSPCCAGDMVSTALAKKPMGRTGLASLQKEICMCPSALEVLASIVPPSLSQVAASAMGHPDPVGSSIRVALAAKQTGSRTNIERRREPRYPYPYPIYITPVDRDLVPLANETVSVLGKHLSEHGLDFYHREPIAHRRVIASLALCEGDWLGLLMDLTWCRFKGQGLYDNGGRFISVTRSPMLSVHEGLKTIRAESGT